MKKFLKWGAVALLVFFVVTQPADAAGVVRSLGNGLVNIASGMSAFVTNLA
ncbi:hypothetical protein [Cryptosporangium aurantiacum]|uniref:Secreted protein n=1 Tax=Cryptosporangium aurantiacum TaxID=134849 RepID=A0A1M7RFN0_9ACTN|nr:hypothetical protein [Cryptosporangium aurantiacum]SHN44972.1 hypothetical protein SAMN05443668_11139 [Cryptosporangium aurantiacum]